MSRLSSRTVLLSVGYIAAIIVTLTALALSLASWGEGSLKQEFLSFFLPDGLMLPGEMLLDYVLEQNPFALVNLLVTTTLALLPILTFPLKEALSAAFERDIYRGMSDWQEPEKSHLLSELINELLLLVVFLSLSMLVFRISLATDSQLATMCMSFVLNTIIISVDFIGPTLIRHQYRVSETYEAVFVRHGDIGIMFGALLALLVAIGSKVAMMGAPKSALYGLMALNVFVILAGVFIGTAVGGAMIRRDTCARHVRPWFRPSYAAAWVVVWGLLFFNGLHFGSLAKQFYHASPVLKCQWAMVDGSFDYEMPTLKRPTVIVSIVVDVTNPTGRKAQITENTVRLSHDGTQIATTSVPTFSVEAGKTSRQTVKLEFKPKGKGLAKKGLNTLLAAKKNGIMSALKTAGKNAIDPKLYGVMLDLPTPTGMLNIKLK